MTNVKKIKLFFFDVNEFECELKTPVVTDIYLASNLLHKGKELYAFGKVNNSNDTTRTSRVREIKFSNGAIHILTQNSDYLLEESR